MVDLQKLNIGFTKKVPLVLQSEVAECGLSCLAMVAGFYGQHHSLVRLRSQFGSSIAGATLKNLINIADQLGFSTRPLRLEVVELHQLSLPCIIHWDLNHFVVLTRVTNARVTLHDPAKGVRNLSLEEFSKYFTGVALELSPNTRFTKAEKPARVQLSQLFGGFIGLKKAFLYLIGLAVLVEIFGLISPLYVSFVIDEALVSANNQLLNILAIGFILILLINTAVAGLRHWTLLGLSATVKAQANENIFSHLVSLPVAFFESRHLGDILARLGSQETILNALTEDFIEALLDGLMVIITLVVMFTISVKLTLLAIVAATLYALVRWISYNPIRQAEMEGIVWSARSETHLLESLRGVRSVKLHNAQSLRRIQWMNLIVESINRNLTVGKISLFVETANKIVMGLMHIIIVWVAAKAILAGSLTIGLLLAFLAYSSMFVSRVSRLIDATVQFNMLSLHAERLADIALTTPEAQDTRLNTEIAREVSPISIELRNVSYRYSDNEPYILKNISLTIGQSEWLAITGPSGSGKSTLLKVLSGLVKPTEGSILINGTPLETFGVSTYRSLIGVVLQDDQLFSGTIQDNISFFTDSLDEEKVYASAKLASIHEEIASFPMGYHTSIGDMGTVLSGGQKQRVLLARSIYKNPDLLLLDEATSHLDVDNERVINRSLSALSMTRVVIAHRQETINAATKVIRLVDGEIYNAPE